MSQEELCENCGELCGDDYCGKCPECGGELEDDHTWPNPCFKCHEKAYRKAAREPLPFDI